MRYISLFSGIEAATVAWEPLGWEPVCFSEIDPFPSAVLAHRFPSVPNYGDITKIDWGEVIERHGAVDLVVGGSPCQSFSIAGGRESLDGESALCFEYYRCLHDVRPRWFVWENVPGVFSTRDNAFGQFLGKLEELGYGMAWRTLDAQFFGVAQRRRRVFLVGHIGGMVGAAAAVLFERDSLRGNTSSSREKKQALASDAGDRPECGGFYAETGGGYQDIGWQRETAPTLKTNVPPTILAMASAAANAEIAEDLSPTILSINEHPIIYISDDNAKAEDFIVDCSNYIVRRLTPRECERLQGFPDDWTRIPYKGKPAERCPDGPRYKACGNSMAVPVMRWIGERIDFVEDVMREMEES